MRNTKKKNSLFTLIAALAALFLLVVIVLLRFDASRDTEPVVLRLWYVNDDRFSSLLADADGAKMLAGTGVSLRIRRFDSEEELADALDGERPEMLYCAGSTAAALSRNGSLKSLSSAMDALPEAYDGLSGNEALDAGEYFPLILEAEILVFRTDAFSASGSFETLAGAYSSDADENAVPFFACSSWYPLFNALTAGSGRALGPTRLDNAENGAFVSAYNTLAECALSGSLYTGGSDPLPAVLNGECLCCAVSSAALTDSVEIAAVDLPGNIGFCVPAADGSISAEAFGLAITAEDEAAAMACVPIIEEFVSLASSRGTLFPQSLAGSPFTQGGGRIFLRGYAPGLDALSREFDEEISRMLSILCE